MDQTKLVYPQVPEGYTIALKYSSNPEILALDGTITPPGKDRYVGVIFTITCPGGRKYRGYREPQHRDTQVLQSASTVHQSIHPRHNRRRKEGARFTGAVNRRRR